jgi:hypothetical protein
MRHILSYVLLVSTILTTTSLSATERYLGLRARITQDCSTTADPLGDWSGQFKIDYHNSNLRWGTSVEVQYGFHGWTESSHGQTMDWVIAKNQSLKAVSPYHWQVVINELIASENIRWFDQIQFVLKVRLPDGRVFYEKGGDTTYGYFAGSFATEAPRGCAREDIGFEPLTLLSVDKY